MHKNSRIIQAWQTQTFAYFIANGWITMPQAVPSARKVHVTAITNYTVSTYLAYLHTLQLLKYLNY